MLAARIQARSSVLWLKVKVAHVLRLKARSYITIGSISLTVQTDNLVLDIMINSANKSAYPN